MLPRAESVKRGEWDLLPTQGILKDGSKQRNQRGEQKKKVARVRTAHEPRLPGLGTLSTADLFFYSTSSNRMSKRFKTPPGTKC